MMVAFQVRSLLERPKVNDKVRSTRMPVLLYKKIGDLPFTVVGPGWLEDRFDMEHPEKENLYVVDVCNQLIHYYWMQAVSRGRTFVSILVFSDYRRHKSAYEFRIEDLFDLFSAFGDDSSVAVDGQFRWDAMKRDYSLEKAEGATKLHKAKSQLNPKSLN